MKDRGYDMKQKMKKEKKLMSFLLTTAMVFSTLSGAVPGVSMRVQAEDLRENWSADQVFDETAEFENGILLDQDVTVTLEDGVALTVEGGIITNGHTLTVKGDGSLEVKGIDGDDAEEGGENGSAGTAGITGNIVVDGPAVTVTGGDGGCGSDGDDGYEGIDGGSGDPGGNGGEGGSGGSGVAGNVTVLSGSIEVHGGKGGEGGSGGYGGMGGEADQESSDNGGNGGDGGNGGKGGDGGTGVTGNVTVNVGSAYIEGGEYGYGGMGGDGGFGGSSGGEGGSDGYEGSPGDDGDDGDNGIAVFGTITGTEAEESEDESDWSEITDSGSNMRYIKVSSPVTYPIWVGGVQVTEDNKDNVLAGDEDNDDAVYFAPADDEDPAMLTLSGAAISAGYDVSSDGKTAGIYYAGTDDLVIVLDTDTENTIEDVTWGIYSTDDDAAVTFSDTGKLTVSGALRGVISGKIKIEDGDITVSATTEGYHAVETADLEIAGGQLTAHAVGAPAVSAHSVTIGEDIWVKAGDDESTAVEVTASFAQSHGQKWVRAAVMEYYPVWVGGKQVTNLNRDDVFGNGKVSYTPSTLKLKGFTYNGPGYKDSAIYAEEDLTIDLTGENTVTHVPGTSSSSYGINVNEHDLTIKGSGTLSSNGGSIPKSGTTSAGVRSRHFTLDDHATVKANGGPVINDNRGAVSAGVYSSDTLTVRGTLEATGSEGYESYGVWGEGEVKIKQGGSVTATADVGGDSFGLRYKFLLTIDGTLTAKGYKGALYSQYTVQAGQTVTESDDYDGTDAGYVAVGSQTAGSSRYVKIEPHIHAFAYSGTGATITVVCNGSGVCPLPVVGGKHVGTLTLGKPTLTTYGQTGEGISKEAVVTDENGIRDGELVYYYKATKIGGAYTKTGTVLDDAPTAAGDYVAEITLGTEEDNKATASVGYTIAKADPVANAPTGVTATYGQTLADVRLSNPSGNTPGTWIWDADTATKVGNAGSNMFAADFTPADSDNYKSVNGVEVTITVGKAENPATVESTAVVPKGGHTVDLKDNVKLNGAAGDVTYAISGEAKGCALKGSVLTSGADEGIVRVNVAVAADDNYNALAAKTINVTVVGKAVPTISANDLTVTYGDKGKSVKATTSGDGAISYAVEPGSGDYIEVNASTGVLTVRKVPEDGKAYIIATAAETDDYASVATKVTVYIMKAASVSAAVTANDMVFDGTERDLVTVTGEARGGEMQYALGRDGASAPTTGWGASVPKGTETGTYYVWYRVLGDADHNDSGPQCVTVTISEKKEEPEEANDWNLYEDGSEHEFHVQGISATGTKWNSNAKSKQYYEAKLEGSTITVKVTGDRKKAAKAANTLLEFDLGADGAVAYTLPVSYVKPVFKLTSKAGTIKAGVETELKTGVLVKDDKAYEPYDLADAVVTGEGPGTVSGGDDGFIVIKTQAAGKVKIRLTKEGWNDADPVELSYTVKASKKDLLTVGPEGLKEVVLNTNAKEQSFVFDVTFNGQKPEEGAVTLEDKDNTGLVSYSDGQLTIAGKDGMTKGTHKITLKAGTAAAKLKVRVSDKPLDMALKLKVLSKYDVTTNSPMVVEPQFRDVSGSIEDVFVEEKDYEAEVSDGGNIMISYTGDSYSEKNLNMGTVTLKLKLADVDGEIRIPMNKVKAKKSKIKVQAPAVNIPKGCVSGEDKVIGSAYIVASVVLSNGRLMILEPESAKIESTKNVTAEFNEDDPNKLDIRSITGSSGTVKVKLTYAGGAEKTVTVKVKVKK